MKRILSLVLCLVIALSAFASCKGHTHTFASEWSSDAENHWHAANCEHTSEKSDLAAHTGTEDGVCDVCEYVSAYIVTVNAPDNVTIDGTLSGAPNTDVTFKATVDDAYALTVNGAEIVGEPEAKDSKLVYTIKVASIKAATTVDISAHKTVYGAEIASGEGAIEDAIAWQTKQGSVTVTLPAAGKYAIFATDESSVMFGANTEDSEFFQVYKFEATQAGELVIKTSVWPMTVAEDGIVPFEYVVVSCEDVTLVGNNGKYTLPAGVKTDITFTAPTAGIYQISSSAESLSWNDMLDSSVILNATEDGQELTFTLQCQDFTASTFEFDYSVIALSANTANQGANNAEITYGKYYGMEFTAPKAGAYSIVIDSEFAMFYQWNSDYNFMQGIWGDFITENLEANEKISFYVLADNEEAAEDTLAAVITITHAGYLVSDENGVYNSQASADGVLNVFNDAWAGATFVIKAPEGFEISVDNGTTWANEVKVTAESGSIAYLVKGAGESAGVTIEEFENKIELTIGTTTVTLTPGVEYNVYVSGYTSQSMWKSIVMSWNNENVSGYAGWAPMVSGGQINNVMAGSAVGAVSLSGDTAAEVTFTVADVTVDDIGGGDIGGGDTTDGTALVLGENSIVVVNAFLGVNVTFTATEAGTYTISAADGELNAACGTENAYGFSTFNLPYEIELAAGESFSFLVMTGNFEADTIDLVVTKN